MSFNMDHVKELVWITYPSSLNKLPTKMIFTRAFFADCFKGVASQSRRSFEEKESLPTCVKATNARPVNSKSGKHSSKYYNSLTYTLSLLQNTETSSEDSESDSSSDFAEEGQKPKSEWVASGGELAQPPSGLVSGKDFDYAVLIEQMRALGLPTSFGGPSRLNPKRLPSAQFNQNYSVDDLDGLFLSCRNDEIVSRSITHSLTDIFSETSFHPDLPREWDDNLYSEAQCILSVICRVLGHGFCLSQSCIQLPRAMQFRLPDSWRHVNPLNARRNIHFSLTGGCSTWRYKPASAKSSRAYVQQQEPPAGLCEATSVDIVEKYWAQRYRLFSRFDEGIQIDCEGLFSVTPEVIAAHHARRLSNILGGSPSSHTVLDLFTGVGGNCIQLALVGFTVVTVDISQSMLNMADSNARVYGVRDRITFIKADAFSFLHETGERFSAVFASPPWGGPSYSSSSIFSLTNLAFSGEGNDDKTIFDLLIAITSVTRAGGPIGLFLPRNSNTGQLFELHRKITGAFKLSAIPLLECELALIHGKPKGVTVYFYSDDYAKHCHSSEAIDNGG
uniref:Trimethylguanosine synthase n=1 Tax=Mesocestoides corti TaxID=53468 RepID=A0A5K3EVI4_MESCO